MPAPRSLSAEVDVSRSREDHRRRGRGSSAAKLLGAVAAAEVIAEEGASLFGALCAAAAPFVTVGYARRIVAGNAPTPNDHTDVHEAEFRFDAGTTDAMYYAVLQPPSGDCSTVDARKEACEILAVLDAAAAPHGASDDDLLYWPHVCLPTDEAEAQAQARRLLTMFEVCNILRCEPKRSVVRIAPSQTGAMRTSVAKEAWVLRA